MNRITGKIITDENEHIKQSVADILLTQIGTRILELRHISSRWITDYRLCRLIQGHSVDITAGYSICWNGIKWKLG
ncbi:hypothetical protein [Necropsobacter rosorum]|uniref:hypothetical protein n=1 Tax=Necropsobacter rosorum TaxID=908285 RepID=UPI000509F964